MKRSLPCILHLALLLIASHAVGQSDSVTPTASPAPSPPEPEPVVEKVRALNDLLFPDGSCTWHVCKTSSAWTWLRCTERVDTLTFLRERKFLARNKQLMLRTPCTGADSLRSLAFEVEQQGQEAVLRLPEQKMSFRVTPLPKRSPVCAGHEPCLRLSSIPASRAEPTMDIYLYRGIVILPDSLPQH